MPNPGPDEENAMTTNKQPGLDFIVVWRKDGSIMPSNVIRAATAQLAYEQFRGGNPGGGLPVTAKFRQEGDITYVDNAGGRTLANIIPIGA